MRNCEYQKYTGMRVAVCFLAGAALGLAACQNHTDSTPRAPAPAAPEATSTASTAGAGAIVSAGFKNLHVPAEGDIKPIDVKLWTPCEKPLQGPFSPGGPFALQAVAGCPVAGAGKFPLIVVSHGRGGTAFAHHDTAEALASAGFIVATFNHPGDNAFDLSNADDFSVLYHRPAQVKRVIDYLLATAPEAERIDANRIGFFGFSRGGYTGLVLAGATPDFAKTDISCPQGSENMCQQLASGSLPNLPLVRDARIKSMVIADPLSFFPTPESVKDVNVPTQLWGTTKGGDGVAPESVALLGKNLTNQPDIKTMPNSNHYSMLAPCTPALAYLEKDICTKDEPGFDRVTAHKEWNAQMVVFFKKALEGK
ncbi:MAG: dienelactone hydrolase [Brachymonas sp.]|nr:dienelactone hydrolase [Brachymonas sp.]